MDTQREITFRDRSRIIINEAPKFELESYIANYKGRTRFDRLFHIGTSSTVLGLDALKAAVQEAKTSIDIQRYELAVLALSREDQEAPEGIIYKEWVERVQKQNAAETNRLEQELKGYKNNLIKESIRMGNEDLGSHYHQIGDLAAATKAYGRMRDYCTTSAHIASMSFRIIQVSIDRGDWLAVMSNVHKIKNLQIRQEDIAKTLPRVQAAEALSHMAQGHYYNAAATFLMVDPSLTDSYNEVMTANDVAVYGGLCALASMNREDLSKHVLESLSFRQFLELEPHIRRAIQFFCASKYSQCLEILDSYRADYLLDIHLQPHYQSIYSAVRSKSIVLYFVPFSRVTLASMAQMFFPKVTDRRIVDDELIDMIERGVLDAKIDLEKRVLVAKESNPRIEVLEKALRTIEGFNKELHLKILQQSALAAGIVVRPPPKKSDFSSTGEGQLSGSAAGDIIGVGQGRSAARGGGPPRG